MLGGLAFYLHYWFSVGMEPLQPHQELGKPQEWKKALYQTALSIIHQNNCCSFSLTATRQGLGCP